MVCHLCYQRFKAVKGYVNCGFEVLTVELLKTEVFWDVSAALIGQYQCFESS